MTLRGNDSVGRDHVLNLLLSLTRWRLQQSGPFIEPFTFCHTSKATFSAQLLDLKFLNASYYSYTDFYRYVKEYLVPS